MFLVQQKSKQDLDTLQHRNEAQYQSGAYVLAVDCLRA